MKVYKVPNSEEMKIVKKYSKAFEDIKISEPALYAGNLYREVIFKKKLFNGLLGNIYYIYLDANNNVVTNKITIARLGRLFFFMDAFLNEEDGSIIKVLQSNEDVAKDKDDLKFAIEGLNLLGKKVTKYNISTSDIESVTKILNNVIELRGKNNEKLQKFLKEVNTQWENNTYFNENIIEACMPTYKEVMLCNYEKVQMIAKEANKYGEIKRAAEKLKRSNNLKLITAHVEALMKLSYIMGYFENLMNSCGNILKMSSNQYLKSIENAGKVNADYKLHQLRS